MTLRRKLVVYLVAAHVLFAVVSIFGFRATPVALVGLEIAFVVWLGVGLAFVRRLFFPLDRIREGARFLADSDFTSRFRPTGDSDTDQLVSVYNRMADHLRDERVRNQEQNFFLERILDASPFGLLTFDFDGRVSSASPRAVELLQIDAAALLGRTLGELDHPTGGSLESIGSGESVVLTLARNRRVKCSRGEFLDRGFVRTFVALTELTEELRQSEKSAYEKLIRMMSHEVNNTVAASTSILHSCLAFHERSRAADRDDYVEGLRSVIDRTEQLNEFMRGFADVVRIPDPKLAPCDLRSVVAHVVRLMEPVAARSGVTLGLDASGGSPEVSCDRIQMEQAFVNIVKNAIEAAADTGGRVDVRIRDESSRVSLVVENGGPTIAPEVAERLFTPFFTTKENGHGIGLTVVQEILTRHGFEFSLESVAENRTCFSIAIPNEP